MKWHHALSAFALLFISGSLNAQIVNVQNMLKGDSKEGFSLALEGSLERKSGNTELERYSGQGSATWKQDKDLYLLIARREYGEQSNKGYLDSSFYHLRYRRTLDERWGWEVFAQDDSDRFRSRASRLVLGSGPHVKVVSSDQFNLALSLAPMYERERFTEDFGGDRDVTKTRASQMVYVDWKWESYLLLSNVLYVQPNVKGWNDRRILNESALLVKLSENVSFKTSYTYTYDSQPPAPVKKADAYLKQSLIVTI